MKVARDGMESFDDVSLLTGWRTAKPSKTVQASKDEADINVILDRFGITGQMPGAPRLPSYEDFGDKVFDYRSALEAVAMAQDAFLELPAKVRAEFDNDPQVFLEFVTATENGVLKNEARMRELGLMKVVEPPAPVVPMPVRVIADDEDDSDSEATAKPS